MEKPKRRGRPPRSENGPATVNLTMRLQPEIYEALRKDAEQYGRSISAQAERRLMYREPGFSDVGRLIDILIGAVERRAGVCARHQDAEVQRQCRVAAEFALNALLGDLPTENDPKWGDLPSFTDGLLGRAVVAQGPSDKELFDEAMQADDEKPAQRRSQ